MKASQILLFVVIGLVVIVLLGGGCVIAGRNRAVGMDEQVKNQWAQVENILQRRFDLIPNLEEAVKGTAFQEQTVFLGIANARKSYFQADNVADKAKAANQFESALSRLLVLQENYPALKSNESFLKLQDEISGSENRLAVARKDYNESARALNTFVRQFPSSFYASLAGVKEAEYFEMEAAAKNAPKVDFSDLKKEGK